MDNCKYSVCPDCEGEGRYLNEALRTEALSEEDACDPEFLEEIEMGLHHVTCRTCKGLRVVTHEQYEKYERDQEWEREHAMELRLCGWC